MPHRYQTPSGDEVVDEAFEGGMTGSAKGGGGYSASGTGALNQSGGDPEHLDGFVTGTGAEFLHATKEAIVDGAIHVIGHHGLNPIMDKKAIEKVIGHPTPDET